MSVLTEWECDPHQGHVVQPQPKAPPSERAREQAAQKAADPEAYRLQRRAKLKEDIAQARLFESQRLTTAAAIQAVNDRKDQLAARHVEAAAPLQTRLKEIEHQQIAGIKGRLPADPVVEQERIGLLDRVRAMNAALEESIRREDSILAQLSAEHLELANKSATCILEVELLYSTGRPDLLLALKVAQSGKNWANRRAEVAAETLGDAQRFQRTGWEQWAAELAAAQAEATRATQAEAAALRAVLDE